MSRLPRAPLGAWLAPEYPHVNVEQARQLRAGVPPRELARQADPDSELTAAEAHRWLSDAPQMSPLRWLSRELFRKLNVAGKVPFAMRSWAVARWAQRVVSSRPEREALLRRRQLMGPGGQVISVRFVDRLDEIQEVDLVEGIRTGVQRAYERAAARVGADRLEELAKDHRVLARIPAHWPRRLGARVRVLVTAAELVAEGREMQHCVGGYAHAVESGRSMIVSIRAGGHRSTAEITPAGEVLQHHGRCNTRPSAVCDAVLRSLLRRIICA